MVVRHQGRDGTKAGSGILNLFISSWVPLLGMELNFQKEVGKCALLSLNSVEKGSVKREINLNLQLSLIKLLSWINNREISWTESTVWKISGIYHGLRRKVRIRFDVKM